MPTTTEVFAAALRAIAGAASALLLWFGGMAALAFVVEPTAVIVFGPPANLARAVEDADASVMRIGERFVVARSNSAGLAKRLYSGGAWFVWPALPAGCVAKKRDG